MYIAKTNGQVFPHALLSRYYSLAGINAHTESFQLYQVSRNKRVYVPLGRTLLCTALIICVQEGQHLWQKLLLEESRDKNRLIRLQGRWKSETSRDMYFKDSIEKRLSLTKSLTEIKI